MICDILSSPMAPLSGYVLEKDRLSPAPAASTSEVEMLRQREAELARELAALDARFGRTG